MYFNQLKTSLTLLFILFTLTVQATVYYVKPIKTGTGDGLSWVNALGNEEFAAKLTVALPNDEFHLASGTYYPKLDAAGVTPFDPRKKTFRIKTDIKLQGGYSANPTAGDLPNSDLFGNAALSGDIGAANTYTDNAYNVVTVDASANNVSLNGITVCYGYADVGLTYGGGIHIGANAFVNIENAYIDHNFASSGGGGIYAAGYTHLTLKKTTIGKNPELGIGVTISRGGGIYMLTGSTCDISESTIIDNSAGTGGGIFTIGSLITIYKSTITGNTANLTYGGGINATASSTLTMAESFVNYNTSKTWGGGIHTDLSNSTIRNTQFIGNTASDGGGFHNSFQSNAILENCLFQQNTTTTSDGGGANFYNGNGTTIVNSCIFRNNTAGSGQGGGAVHNESGNLIISNTTISGNTARMMGGGITRSGGTLSLTNTTITKNTNTTGASNAGIQGAPNVLRNCIVSDNTANGVEKNMSALSSAAYNIIGSEYYISGTTTAVSGVVFNAASHLAPLQNNGGNTFTHALIGDNNPATDKGDPSILTDANTLLQYDQRGIKRISPSIGAYEKMPFKANNDYTTIFNTKPGLINVLLNDSLDQCKTLVPVIVTQPKYGTATLTGQNIEYTANIGYIGRDTLKYSITCGSDFSEAYVFINVIAYPDNISDAECFGDVEGDIFTIRHMEYDNSLKDIYQYFSPVVADVDNDKYAEILGALISDKPYYGKNIAVMDGQTGKLKSTIPTPYIYHGVSPAVAKINGETLVFVATGGTVSLRPGAIALNPTAEALKIIAYKYNSITKIWDIKWVSDKPYNLYNTGEQRSTNIAPMIADMNGDGTPEIIIRGDIFNAATGTLLASLPNDVPLYGQVVSIGDVLEKGQQQLVIADRIYSVKLTNTNAFNTNAYTLERQAPTNILMLDKHSILADFNNDGHLDVFIVGPKTSGLSSGTIVYAIWDVYNDKFLGTPAETPNIAGGGGFTLAASVPFAGDVDGDGFAEVVFMTYNKIYCYKYNMLTDKIELFWDFAVDDQSGTTGITLFDFNQDGKSELVYRDESKLWILDGSKKNNCTPISSFSNIGSNTGYEYPVVADVNGDGEAEIITFGRVDGKGDGAELFVLGSTSDKKWAPARKVWNQYAYNSVNVNEDLTIPTYQLSPATVFPGKDGILGTTDDVRPYNGFLQQQTTLNKNGNPLWILPDYVLSGVPTLSYDKQKDSVYVSFCITNNGDIQGSAPIYFSLYKNEISAGNKLVADSSMLVPEVGEIACYKIGTKIEAIDSIKLAINDKGEAKHVAKECDYNNNAFTIKSLIQLQNATVTVFACDSISYNIVNNNGFPTGSVITIKRNTNPASSLTNGIVKYSNTGAECCSLGGNKDTLVYKVCNGVDCDTATLLINILRCPEIILLDSCSTKPKFSVMYQYMSAVYDWEYYNGTTWIPIATAITTPELPVNTAGKYRLTVHFNGLTHKVNTGVELIENKKIELPGGLIWFSMTAIPIDGVWP